jgi:ABC-type transport system involved in multi-copper enzyme maturation permease subunit
MNEIDASLPTPEVAPSPVRAWVALVFLSIRRQARIRQMVWLALGLLALTATAIGLISARRGWNLTDQTVMGRYGPTRVTYRRSLERLSAYRTVMPQAAPGTGAYSAIIASSVVIVDNSGFVIFSRWVVFAIFQSFLLPLWTLSFSTDAIGNERESRTLIWLTTRPLPRSAIYLAKYVSLLPWCLGINIAGFGVICWVAGDPGHKAFWLYLMPVVYGTLAFGALFHLFAAMFRRPAVIGLVYSFFFETLVGDMPGDLKRLSVNFYVRSLMFDSTRFMGIEPDQLTVYSPVSGWTARGVLLGITIVLLGIGMYYFSRAEYREDI